MDNSKKETTLFVALPGAEPYAEIPKAQVKDQLAKGQLKQSALIWSQKHNSWKQARHISQLIASKLAPRPAQPRLATQQPQTAQPQVAAAAQPKMQQAAQASTTSAAAGQPIDYTIEQPHRTSPWLKGVCAALVVIIVSLLVFNWFYVDHALKSNLDDDNGPFKDVPVYAHLAGFFQTDCIIIHLRPTSQVNRYNFIQYLTAIAAATPDRPFRTSSFADVSLASGWSADYHINGIFWRRLSRSDLTDDDRRALLIENLRAGGSPLVPPNANLDPVGRAALEEKRWNEFVSTFISR